MIEAFIIAWNEIETIHLTIQHYQKFCDKITIYDNFSDDGTYEKSHDMGCEVRQFGRRGELDDRAYLEVKNNCYRSSKAKFVIVCDSDEILDTDRETLEQSNGTYFNTIGWDIFSNDMPVNDFLEIQRGQFTPNYCKKVIFNPKIRINYTYGCHVCTPVGVLQADSKPLTLFHYSNIGGFKRLSDRHAVYRTRLSRNNRQYGLGCHYSFSEEQRKRERDAKYDASIEYSDFNLEGVDIMAL